MHARRALLYMPGDDMRKIRKAVTLGVDCICMDMEDGVALNRKEIARQTICEALQTIDFGKAEKLARINAIGSGMEGEDLEAVLAAHPDGIVVPKIESGDQVRWASQEISRAEERYGWQPGGIGLIVLVETARGVIQLADIASADRRLQAIIFGAEDFIGDIGGIRTREAWEVFYARSAVVAHASAFGLQAIDMVCVDFQDIDRIRQESIQGAQMGYVGKQVIHPNQVAPVQQAFTPSEEAIQRAKVLLEAFRNHQALGKGAFAIDGKMVDMPIIRAAERVLERASAAGRL